MAEFRYDVDIANRAAQHLGQTVIASSITDLHTAATNSAPTKLAIELDLIYDKRRTYELNRNLWVFATRRAMLRPLEVSTLLWTPPTYSAVTTYSFGQVVVDSNGMWWQSQISSNVGNTPSSNTTQWRQYFGPDTLLPFVAPATSLASPAVPTLTAVSSGALGAETIFVTVTYVGAAGETVASGEAKIVLTANQVVKVTSPIAATGATSYNVYAANISGNETLQTSSPITLGTDWTMPTTGLILGAGQPTQVAVIYFAGELVSLNGVPYLSLTSNNSDTPPTPNWVAVNGTTTNLRILYPIGAGPLSSLTTLNVFRLPKGFLRQAPEDPKGASSVWLGAMRGNTRKDWTYEGDYLVSANTLPIMVRFVADIADVGSMNPMFCELLAVDMAMQLCEKFTQGAGKKEELRKDYKLIADEARKVNAILVGPVDPDLDDYLRARI